MQSNSFLGLESYSRVKYNVSEIGDCRIAVEQGHSFTTVLRIIRISAWKQVYNNVKCFTYKICKTRDQDPDRVNSRAVHGASRKSHHANMESRRSQKSSTNSCPAVPVILSSKLSSRGHLPVPRSAEVNTHPTPANPGQRPGQSQHCQAGVWAEIAALTQQGQAQNTLFCWLSYEGKPVEKD